MRLFKPNNCIVLLYDHFDKETSASFEDQLEEVGRHYSFTKFGEIVDGLLTRNFRPGSAAIGFTNARKSVLLRAIPTCLSRGIPFTLFLRPDCIGLNRLPLEEELTAYISEYPQAKDKLDSLLTRTWTHPDEVNVELQMLRKTLGPLPVLSMDPTRFFATWGEILEVDPGKMECGYTLIAKPSDQNVLWLQEGLSFIQGQVKVPVKVGYSPQNVLAFKQNVASLGLIGLVTETVGAVERSSDPFCIPHWRLV